MPKNPDANKNYYWANRDKAIKVSGEYRKSNPDRVKKWWEDWFIKNKSYVAQYRRERYASDPERFRRESLEYAKKNPEKARALVAKRRARIKSAGGVYTKSDIDRIMKSQRSKCAYCRTYIKNKYHVDHIVAIVNGGNNNPANLQLLCVSCNCRKSAKDPIKFAQEIGMLL